VDFPCVDAHLLPLFAHISCAVAAVHVGVTGSRYIVAHVDAVK